MEAQSPLMAVLLNESDMAFANQVANAMGYPYADVVVGTPLDANYALNARASAPAYIIIDIGDRSNDVLSELDTMAENCESGTRVVVIGAVNDVNFYRELRGRGVIEYFTRPAKISDIRAALMYDDGNSNVGESKVITFMSAASGDGASTVALNTAYSVAQHTRETVVLIDMDFQWGMIAKNLDLNSPFGIKELFEHPDRGIDATLINRMLVGYGDHLKIISAPNDLRQLPIVQPEIIRDLINTLREQYKYVFIDLPHMWNMWVSAAVNNSTHAVMIAQLWLRSVTHSSRILNVWREMGMDDDDIYTVINRSGAKFKEAISSKDYERVCDKPIDFYLTNDIKTIAAAENQGKTVHEVGLHALLQRQFDELALKLIGAEEEPSQPSVNQGKSGFSLFSKKSS